MFFLVVDDELSIRMFVANLLETSGMAEKVLVCPDAKSALADLSNQPVDFVISDWNMPGLSGLDLLRTIRTSEDMAHVQNIPVLLLTSEASRNHILEAAKAGVTDYVVKPFKPDTLLGKIQRIAASQTAQKR